MILLILVSIPLFKAETWFNNVSSYENGVSQLAYFANSNMTEFNAALPVYIDYMIQKAQPLVYISVEVNSSCC